MMRCRPIALVLALLAAASAGSAQAQSAGAEQDRDYCPSRPGLGTTPCTIAPGHVSVETAVADWTREDTADERGDTILIGDTIVRVGLSDRFEAQVGWTPFGHERTRDKASGLVEKADRVGDVSLGFKANLRQPDGSGFSAAIQPFVTVPVGRSPIGDGDWGAGMVVPVSFDLSPTLNLQLSPEIDAAVDEDRHGRHLAYGSVVGLGVAVSDAVNLTFELAATKDDDPEEHSTEAYGAASASWMPAHDLQLDLGTTLGLNHAAPDVEVYVGISRLL